MLASQSTKGYPKALYGVLGFLLVILIGWLDYWTGVELTFGIFYLIPIYLYAWYMNRMAGVLQSILCTVVGAGTEYYGGQQYSHPLIFFWNEVARLGFYLIVAVELSRLKSSLDHERLSARTDSTTGLANGRAFFESAGALLQKPEDEPFPLSLLFFDVDDFKGINDRLGHRVGDTLLSEVGAALAGSIRQEELAARVGGDEFVVLLPNCDAAKALKIAQRIKKVLDECMAEHQWPTTFSIGAATFLTPPEGVESFFSKADGLMYLAKTSGKDRIEARTFE